MRDVDYDLVAFDMDGVLVDYVSSWAWVHRSFEVDNSEALHLFKTGRIDESEFIRRDIALWRTVKPEVDIKDIVNALRDVPLIDGIQETVAALRYNGIKAVIISGGIDIVAQRIALGFDFDDYAANTLLTDQEGKLTGEGHLNVDLSDKGLKLLDFMKKYGVEKERVASIGNSFVDVKMFQHSQLSIAFNPIDEEVTAAADTVVKSRNISAVLEYLLAEPQS